jgi:3-oxoacyl-[acyl-carrier protein] reductase
VAEGGTVAPGPRRRIARDAFGGAAYFEVDVTDFQRLQQAAERSFAALGRIDILVAGAGITGPNVPLADGARPININ